MARPLAPQHPTFDPVVAIPARRSFWRRHRQTLLVTISTLVFVAGATVAGLLTLRAALG